MLDTRRSIPPGNEYNTVRRTRSAELKRFLKENGETWWAQRASEMELASASGNAHKLFRLIRDTGNKKPCVRETIYENKGECIHKLQRWLRCWAELIHQQLCWPRISPPPSPDACSAPSTVDISSPTEEEVSRELRLLKRHKSPGLDGLLPALFKDDDARCLRINFLISNQLEY
ncbi:unnamed protein product [Echinostoma caproni]|uniref:Reverse transcriptase domain-containing protein n=1 Tax=Echinostoma caproni TaxID=27848 RepID=A0A183AZ30_9TREM|nr:unnamed protein product [Echinostoma caproni]